MSKQDQIKINLELSGKLMSFIVKNKSILKKYSGCSYVVFTSNTELNSLNEKLVLDLKEEGRKVIKAHYTKEEKKPLAI